MTENSHLVQLVDKRACTSIQRVLRSFQNTSEPQNITHQKCCDTIVHNYSRTEDNVSHSKEKSEKERRTWNNLSSLKVCYETCFL